jgi:hypothetical protein
MKNQIPYLNLQGTSSSAKRYCQVSKGFGEFKQVLAMLSYEKAYEGFCKVPR